MPFIKDTCLILVTIIIIINNQYCGAGVTADTPASKCLVICTFYRNQNIYISERELEKVDIMQVLKQFLC